MIDLRDLLETLAAHLKGTQGLAFVLAWPDRLPAPPGAVLHYRMADVEEAPQRLIIEHTIDIEIIVAPVSDIGIAISRASALVDAVIARVHSNITLGGLVANVRVRGIRRDEARYGGQTYVTFVVTVAVIDVSATAFT